MKLASSGRTWILSIVWSGIAAVGALASPASGQFQNLEREPNSVSVTTETGAAELKAGPRGAWSADGISVRFVSRGKRLQVELTAPGAAMKTLQIHWHGNLPADWKYLGDAWERAYGDLEWKPLDGQRIMPWYFMASSGEITHGYGVMTGPGALCYWTVDETGTTLHADVRCGGKGVELGRRTLEVCTVVSRSGELGETPFAATRAFCREMCPNPRLPMQPVYGFNDWYCTYGHDTADNFLVNVAYLASLNPNNSNPPFAVVDDGWQWKGVNNENPGRWNQTSPNFSATLSMADFAGKIKALDARPGLWYRPLIASADQPQSWRLQRDPAILDPTVPEVRALIRATMARFRGWGYQLIKHDYTTYDICGRWGAKMGGQVTADGWAFADRTRTTAEVVRDLYRDLRESAGDDTLILGCNTLGHLSAGWFELQRIGDDTSGNEWSRTRQMGVNCLAFRAPQNGTFFAVDADCAGQTSRTSVPWEKNSQWLNLLAHSGTALFVSFPHETVSPEQEPALRAALLAASRPQPLAEPLDWQSRRIPEHWRLDNHETSFSW
jgi:alpha-galactosidase